MLDFHVYINILTTRPDFGDVVVVLRVLKMVFRGMGRRWTRCSVINWTPDRPHQVFSLWLVFRLRIKTQTKGSHIIACTYLISHDQGQNRVRCAIHDSTRKTSKSKDFQYTLFHGNNQANRIKLKVIFSQLEKLVPYQFDFEINEEKKKRSIRVRILSDCSSGTEVHSFTSSGRLIEEPTRL